jgi:glycogen operon protein
MTEHLNEKKQRKGQIREGTYNKFGAEQLSDGICFTFEGEKDSTCALRLYDKRARDGQAGYRDIPVPREYCLGAVRSLCVPGLDPRRYDYNYVIDGQVVVDPYAKRIVGREKWADPERRTRQEPVRSGFDFSEFDWENDHCPEIPGTDMVLYKLHVRGFTKDAPVGRKKGDFEALAEQIPYFKELGITTLELMPVYEFEELMPPRKYKQTMNFEGWSPQAIRGYQLMQQKEFEEKEKTLPDINYWGYGAGNYFAPKASYARTAPASLSFKSLVRALHQAGLECVLEMSFDGLANPNFIVEVLRHWLREYHVDGFHLLCGSAAITSVIHDPLLRRSKIFAQSFPKETWEQKGDYPHLYVYNDEFLYAARKQINHQDANLAEFLNQQKKQHPTVGFVNYFANNNGFTLADTFSYATKHNEANGEDGVDGNDWNHSVNCGVEGPSRKKKINEQRLRLKKQAVATVLLAQGVPLLLAGDEFGNSQNGNNNAYCQDNKVGWLNWRELEKNREYFEFVKQLLALRRAHAILRSRQPMRMSDYAGLGLPDLSYHGEQAWAGDIYPSQQAVGLVYCGAYEKEDEDLYIGWNFAQDQRELALPKIAGTGGWQLLLGDGSISEEGDHIRLPENGVAVLVTEKETSAKR